MHLQVAANVRQGDEVGQLPLFGRFDFARHLAQFRLDVGELQLGVDFLFGFAGDDFAALERGERVLVERPAHVVGAAAQRDVVLLRAGEVQQRRAEVFLAQQPQIHLQLAVEQDADFVFAVRERLVDRGIAQNVFGDRVDVLLIVVARLHGEQQVEVADGFAAAPQRAGGRYRFDLLAGFEDVGRVAAGFCLRPRRFSRAPTRKDS